MSMGIIDSIDELVKAYRDLLVRARIPAESVDIKGMISNNLIYNILTGTILLLACRTLFFKDNDPAGAFLVNLLISIGAFLLIFLISTIILTFRPNQEGQDETDRWSVLLIFIWIYSLVLIVLDQGAALLFKTDPIVIGFVAKIFATQPSGAPYAIDSGYFAAAITYSLLAIIILLARSFLTEGFKRRDVIKLAVSSLIGLIYNSVLVLIFVFSGVPSPPS